MGYTTKFEGRFDLDRPLVDEHRSALAALYDEAPSDSPGGYCQWQVTDDGAGIEWDREEKFYDYVKWLEYLTAKRLAPWGYVLNGRVTWQGESRDDRGVITVDANVVKVRKLPAPAELLASVRKGAVRAKDLAERVRAAPSPEGLMPQDQDDLHAWVVAAAEALASL
jgi:hypothetical protein